VLKERLEQVRQRIAQACQRSRRDPSSVELVCVTKGASLEAIREAVRCGVTVIGENRVQEANAKHAQLHSAYPTLQWHLVGHLQRNKAKEAVELFDVIHSVDSVALAEELERQVAKGRRGIEVFIQVNVSGESTKFGCAPDKALGLARAVLQLSHLRLRGLMTIPPFSDNLEEARPVFRKLRELRDELQQQVFSQSLNHPITQSLQLSMGMSHDFEVAIEEGADVVRIGTAIFKGQGAK